MYNFSELWYYVKKEITEIGTIIPDLNRSGNRTRRFRSTLFVKDEILSI